MHSRVSFCKGFYDLLLHHGLVDLGFAGPPFTWCNGRQGARRTKERLDKGFANTAFSILFPRAIVHHLPRTSSDHCPLLLESQGRCSKGPKPFKFEQFWLKESTSGAVIKGAWNTQVEGSTTFQLSKKIGACSFW